MATIAECIKGKCGCPDATACAFSRCKNCDWPIDANGKTMVDHSCDEYHTCPECGGPTTENMRQVYGALDWELSDQTKREIAEIERNTREAHRLAPFTYFD